jgi:hypothetical protein
MADREIADSLASLVRVRLQTEAFDEALPAAQRLVDSERALATDSGVHLAEALALRASAQLGLRQTDLALADAREALEVARRGSSAGGPALARFERLVQEIEAAGLR